MTTKLDETLDVIGDMSSQDLEKLKSAIQRRLDDIDDISPRTKLLRSLRHEHLGSAAEAARQRDDELAGLEPRQRLKHETSEMWRGKGAA